MSEILKINGADMPSPSSLIPGKQDIVHAERNARGKMIIEMIRKDVNKLESSWSFLTDAELRFILNAISPTVFDVTFNDVGVLKTVACYKGDRKMPIFDFRNGVPRYKDVTVNFIEL